jgi:uncharacterized MnhB-related membrane protein
MMAQPFDYLLVTTLLVVAVGALASRKLFTSAVLFIVFGLFMAIGWVRLEAPDIALAEAAVGAGVTGALVLDAIGHLQPRATPHSDVASRPAEPNDA